MTLVMILTTSVLWGFIAGGMTHKALDGALIGAAVFATLVTIDRIVEVNKK